MICQKVIAPNMRLREFEVEMFEDNAIGFIRMDIEGNPIRPSQHSPPCHSYWCLGLNDRER